MKALRKLAAKLGVSPEYLETGSGSTDAERRELRLATAELELSLAADTTSAEAELAAVLAEARAAGDAAAAARAARALGMAAGHQGRQAAAIALLEEALAHGNVLPTEEPRLYTVLARSYASAGRLRAVELV